MLNTFMLSLAVALWGCGESDKYSYYEGDAASDAAITISQETFAVSEEGGSVTINVTTTAKEWGAYATDDFIKVDYENTNSSSGTVTIAVEENPTSYERTGAVVIMSGNSRESITVSQDASLDSNAPEGYKLVWHEEFNSGSELNAADWTHEVQNSGWVNHELQNYVNHKTPEGALVTEVYAKVREGWTYGYIEASIKLPKGKGTWPAFWMMPVNFHSWPADGEIDIMEEVGYHANYVSSSLHANAHVHTAGTQVTHEMLCPGAEDDFHTYAILWTADNITTYVDGQVQLSYNNRGLGRDDWPYDDPFYVILNLAWGGDWGGAQGVDESALPTTMEVDYVRVFQKK